jgi:hypothetical protein
VFAARPAVAGCRIRQVHDAALHKIAVIESL